MLLYWLDRKAFWTIGNPAYGLMTFSATCSMFVFTRQKTLDTCNEIKHKEWRRYFICCRHHTHPHPKNQQSSQSSRYRDPCDMIFSSTSFWQSGIKVQIRIFSCLRLISHWQKHWLGMGMRCRWWREYCCTQPGHSSFQHRYQCWCLHAARKMRDNSRDGRKPSLQPKILPAVPRKPLMASFNCVVVPRSAPLIRRCPSGQPGRG